MKRLIHMILCGLILVTVPACTRTVYEYKDVMVPVPVECEVEQVETVEYPAATGDEGIFDLAKIALAKIGILEAEVTRLRAANANPCPA